MPDVIAIGRAETVSDAASAAGVEPDPLWLIIAAVVVLAVIAAAMIGARHYRRKAKEEATARQAVENRFAELVEQVVDDHHTLLVERSPTMHRPSTIKGRIDHAAPVMVEPAKPIAGQHLPAPVKARKKASSKAKARKVETVADHRPTATVAMVDEYAHERIVAQPGGEIGATALHRDFVAWCNQRSMAAISQKLFGKRLGELGFSKEKQHGVVYLGIAFRTEPEPSSMPAAFLASRPARLHS